MNYQNKIKKNFDISSYSLIIDEAQMLLNNISLFEIICDIINVGLISATIQDISSLSIVQDYYIFKPNLSTQYEGDLYIHQLNNDENKTRQSMIDLIHRERSNYDKVIVKIEDKKEGQLLKESSNDLNVAIYNCDKKDIEINKNGKIYDKTVKDKKIDVIISTSIIQAGQSFKHQLIQ